MPEPTLPDRLVATAEQAMPIRIAWRVASEHGATIVTDEPAARAHAHDLINRGASRVEIEPQEIEEETRG